MYKQECIPVGCVPPTTVAVTGGGAPHPPEQAPPQIRHPLPEQTPQSRHPPGQIPLNFPLGAGLDQIPYNLLLGCGPGPDPPQLPPWVWAWKPARHAGIPLPPQDLLQGMLGYHLQSMHAWIAPPVNRIKDACENITLPQLRSGR